MFLRGMVLLLAACLPIAMQAQMQPQRDECDVHAPGVCAWHVVEDEGGILTSPLRVRAKDFLWIVPFGLATGVAIDYDAHAMRSLGFDTQRQNDFRHVSDAGVYAPVAGVVAGYAVGAVRHDDYMKQTAVLAGEAMVDSLILNEGLKYAINRQSPSQGDGTGRFWPHGRKTWPDGQSMPSNHSIFGERSGMMYHSTDLASYDRNEAVLLTYPANPDAPTSSEDADQTRLEDRWILSRLYATANAVNTALEAYRFDEAASSIYQFFWGDLCDWYLELAKLRMETGESHGEKALPFLLFSNVFESSLRMLSPFMPFITEEIWHAFYLGNPPARSIALMPYPVSAQPQIDEKSEEEMALLQSLIVSVRAARKDAGVPERESIPILLRTGDASVFQQNFATIQRLARVTTLEVVPQLPEGLAHRATAAFDVAVVYEKPVDLKAERERLTKELAKLQKEKENSDRQLNNDAFRAKAPENVVEGLRRRNAELTVLIERTRTSLDALPV